MTGAELGPPLKPWAAFALLNDKQAFVRLFLHANKAFFDNILR